MLLKPRPGAAIGSGARGRFRVRFRRWRRTRPFWGGLLLILAGAELMLVPLSPLTVLVALGLGGLAALGIGGALITAGLFLWFLPHTRQYVSVHALLLSVLSFAATNLGGFLVGMLLGIAGAALAFGWTPEPEPAQDGPEPPEPLPPASRFLAPALPVVLLAALTGPGGSPADGRAEAVGPPCRAPEVTTSRFAPEGFALAGPATVRTACGPVRVLVFRMRAASLSDYRLDTRDGGRELALGARSLRLRGEVTLYLTRLSGCVEGILCLTFAPDGLPAPPVIPPFVFLTDVVAGQAAVRADEILTDGLSLGAA
ncbi:DUF6114 domain-containing protein [Streptomyces sp. NPDC097619]|uniref:DUF6114 domain-containing protein n=1 Tax=Streptomyces sp. NPDC097619 TaxID=3157228 RepID=UPI00332BD6DA